MIDKNNQQFDELKGDNKNNQNEIHTNYNYQYNFQYPCLENSSAKCSSTNNGTSMINSNLSSHHIVNPNQGLINNNLNDCEPNKKMIPNPSLYYDKTYSSLNFSSSFDTSKGSDISNSFNKDQKIKILEMQVENLKKSNASLVEINSLYEKEQKRLLNMQSFLSNVVDQLRKNTTQESSNKTLENLLRTDYQNKIEELTYEINNWKIKYRDIETKLISEMGVYSSQIEFYRQELLNLSIKEYNTLANSQNHFNNNCKSTSNICPDKDSNSKNNKV